jgi:hypothetical protein
VLLCFILSRSEVAMSSKPEATPQSEAKKGGNTNTSKETASGTPYPRRVLIPPVTYATRTQETVNWDFKAARFTLLVTLATWNRTSRDVLQALQSRQAELARRGIKVLALYPEETKTSFEENVTKDSIQFEIGRSDEESLSILRGLDIPGLWIVNSRSEILKRKHKVNTRDVRENIDLVLRWTDF